MRESVKANTTSTMIYYSRRLAISVGFFHCFRLLTGAMAAIFFLKSGISLSDLAILQLVFSSTVLIINYPLGILCDKYGGKWFAYSACLTIAAFYFLCTFASNLNVLVFAHFLNAIGLSFLGCASSAWVVALKNREQHTSKNYINYLGHLSNEIEAIGGVISGLLGATMVYVFDGHGYKYVFYITSALMLCLSFVMLSIPASYNENNRGTAKKISEILHLNFRQILHSKEVLYFMLASSLVVVLYQPIFHYWQPYFVGFDVVEHLNENILLGVCFALFSLSKYLFNRHVKVKILDNDNIDLMKMAIGICVVVIPLFNFIAFNQYSLVAACIAFCILHGLLSLVSSVVYGQYLKSSTEGSVSSIMSLSEILGRLLTIGYFALLYKFLEYYQVRQVFYISCVLTATILVILYNWRREVNASIQSDPITADAAIHT